MSDGNSTVTGKRPGGACEIVVESHDSDQVRILIPKKLLPSMGSLTLDAIGRALAMYAANCSQG